MNRILVLILIAIWGAFVQFFLKGYALSFPEAAPTIVFGLILLIGYLVSDLMVPLKLPRITAYLLVGLMMGPFILGTISRESLSQLAFIDTLALNFIGLAAGSELFLTELRKKIKPIVYLILLGGLVIFIGMTLSLRFLPISFFKMETPQTTWIVVILSAVIALARSPSSVIAVVSETRARGPFTETVMGVTVALDVVIILLFALTTAISSSVLNPDVSIDLTFLLSLCAGIILSFAIGIIVGWFISFYFKMIASETIFFVLALVFTIARVSDTIAHAVHDIIHVPFHLEPMIICMTAGFVARNFGKASQRLLDAIEKGALPVYVLFFALTGANLDIGVLKTCWHIALLLSVLRFIYMMIGGYIGARLAGESPRNSRLYGLTFITQAGVSFGLVKMLKLEFSGWGVTLGTILIATIIINQIIGPILIKYALEASGETGARKY